jgi:hypothetical protein
MSYKYTGLLKGAACGHDHLLWKYTIGSARVSFTDYYAACLPNLSSPSFQDQVDFTKTFPIVFHLLDDGVTFTNTNLDVNYILSWINHWFSAANINFRAAEVDPNGNEMPTPGLNIIDASNLTQVRNSTVYSYANDFVALDEYEDYSENIPIPGILLESIQEDYSWDNSKYLNIIFVNRTLSGSNNKVAMTVGNPILADRVKESLLTGVIDLWALGRSGHSATNDNSPSEIIDSNGYAYFGYEYPEIDNGASSTSQGGLSIDSAEYARGRAVVHTLGHMLGLPHVRTMFGWRPPSHNTCPDSQYYNAKTIFSENFLVGIMYEDPFDDTIPTPEIHIPITYSNFTTQTCSGDIASNEAVTHMHINQFTNNWYNASFGYFTEQQIKWMHANCYYNISSGSEYGYGILGRILENSNNIFIQPTDLCSTQNTTVINTPLSPNPDLQLQASEMQQSIADLQALMNSI